LRRAIVQKQIGQNSDGRCRSSQTAKKERNESRSSSGSKEVYTLPGFVGAGDSQRKQIVRWIVARHDSIEKDFCGTNFVEGQFVVLEMLRG